MSHLLNGSKKMFKSLGIKHHHPNPYHLFAHLWLALGVCGGELAAGLWGCRALGEFGAAHEKRH